MKRRNLIVSAVAVPSVALPAVPRHYGTDTTLIAYSYPSEAEARADFRNAAGRMRRAIAASLQRQREHGREPGPVYVESLGIEPAPKWIAEREGDKFWVVGRFGPPGEWPKKNKAVHQ